MTQGGQGPPPTLTNVQLRTRPPQRLPKRGPGKVNPVYISRPRPLGHRDGPLAVYGFRVRMRGLMGTLYAAQQLRQTPLAPQMLPKPSLGDQR